jgi:hypothetical protein
MRYLCCSDPTSAVQRPFIPEGPLEGFFDLHFQYSKTQPKSYDFCGFLDFSMDSLEQAVAGDLSYPPVSIAIGEALLILTLNGFRFAD